ncbi:MAG: FtsW/RodA/SpoVE family cell cycle protein [Rubricoccaceae bacterium]
MRPWYKNLAWPVVLAWVALVAIGLTAIYSATHGPAREFLLLSVQQNFNRQVQWFVISAAVMGAVLLTPARLIMRLAPLAYAGGIGLLLATLALGEEINGARAWLRIGPATLQGGELARIGTLLLATSLLSRKEARQGKLSYLLAAGGAIVLPVVLLVAANDTGTGLPYLAMIPALLFWSGTVPLPWLALLLAPAVAGYLVIVNPAYAALFALVFTAGMLVYARSKVMAALGFLATAGVSVLAYIGLFRVLQPHQIARIVAFDNPEAFRETAGFHVIQAKAAIGSGGLFGKGFTNGTQTQLAYIPEQSTDFIFCVIGEEFGFVGAMILLGLFGFLLIRLTALGMQASFALPRLFIAGLTGMWLTHILINIGMTIGLMPVIGIPLPFVSYGGSALLANTTMLAIALNLHARRDEFAVYRAE